MKSASKTIRSRRACAIVSTRHRICSYIGDWTANGLSGASTQCIVSAVIICILHTLADRPTTDQHSSRRFQTVRPRFPTQCEQTAHWIYSRQMQRFRDRPTPADVPFVGRRRRDSGTQWCRQGGPERPMAGHNFWLKIDIRDSGKLWKLLSPDIVVWGYNVPNSILGRLYTRFCWERLQRFPDFLDKIQGSYF